MRFTVFTFGVALLAGLLFLQSGCGPGKAFDQASAAEKRGDVGKAYDHYCQAARRNPGNGSVASGIKRTGPVASSLYETQATAAMDDGRFADAWKLLMRAIEIRPNNPSAVYLVRRLEKEHDVEIADARDAWKRQGSLALKVNSSPVSLAKLDAVKPSEADEVKSGSLTADSSPESSLIVDSSSERTLVADASAAGSLAAARAAGSKKDPIALWVANLPASDSRADDGPSSKVGRPSSHNAPEAGVAAGEPRIASAPSEQFSSEVQVVALTGDDPNGPGRSSAGRAMRPVVQPLDFRKAASRSDKVAIGESQALRQDSVDQGGTLFVQRTLSKKNRRYARRALLVDGIVAKLKDTDDDLDADIDLYDGDKRITKIRSLEIGQSKTFRGHSGKRYDLTILSIHHKSHTVRIGVKPASVCRTEDA